MLPVNKVPLQLKSEIPTHPEWPTGPQLLPQLPVPARTSRPPFEPQHGGGFVAHDLVESYPLFPGCVCVYRESKLSVTLAAPLKSIHWSPQKPPRKPPLL